MHPPYDNIDAYASDIALLPPEIRRLPLQCLKVVVKPGTRTLLEVMDQARWSMICVQLTALLLLVSVIDYLFYLLRTLKHTSMLQSIWSFASESGVVVNVLAIPFFMLVGIGVLHWLTYLLGGRGKFLTMLYTNLLFQVPLLLLSAIINDIPGIISFGEISWIAIACSVISIAIQLYTAVLQALALKAVHGLSQSRAVVCVLLLVLFSLPLVIFLSIIIL
ncbi:YIP1 family protein [Ktedonospora formicarum]|uniref:Yip1 domain-containing protein n=1 Tax=Ktedonospora formicarum TaxID=2778364 RepID=A0A8J3ICA3_9CHLR|nr:YIP1 family protein [Ktedonospora formicarum]GHO49474.1 hypothetical protein KSX_76370 [Ktedonospora formicarum]